MFRFLVTAGLSEGACAVHGQRKTDSCQIYATTEERKQRNRQAQAAFRERRTEYIKQLESTINMQEATLNNLNAAHRQTTDECLMLRYKNSLLERVLLEKGKQKLLSWRETSAQTILILTCVLPIKESMCRLSFRPSTEAPTLDQLTPSLKWFPRQYQERYSTDTTREGPHPASPPSSKPATPSHPPSSPAISPPAPPSPEAQPHRPQQQTVSAPPRPPPTTCPT